MRITLPSGTPAEMATPSGTPRAGLVIVPDNFGLRPLFDEMCSSLAEQNQWTVCAVELWPGREHLDKDEKWAVVPSLDEMSTIRDLDAAADATGCEMVFLVGFCMGGMHAFRAAGFSTKFERIASFYGMIRLPQAAKSATQSEPIDALRVSKVPVLAVMGGKDVWCPRDHIDELAALENVEVIEFTDAGHAFAHDPSREEHRPDDAKVAWRKVIEFLEEPSGHLK